MKQGYEQATGAAGMVSTAFPSASEAGVEILRAGGNAIDAAVAAAWALSVCEPSSSGLGGQTILLIRFTDGRILVVDGHSHAPAAVSTSRVSGKQQQRGHRACTIPSTPATLEYAHKRYGVLPRATVMEPAIRLAEEGYMITSLQRRQTKWCRKALLASPAASRLFLREGRSPLAGDVFQQKELAATLRRLADIGTEDFYRGRIADAIADDMAGNGGLITRRDLAEYEGPVECEPLAVEYRDCQVVSVPPPAGGMQVLLGLKILEHFTPDELARQTDRWYEVLAEVTHAVFRERKRFMLHPRDSTPLLLTQHLSDEVASDIVRHIQGRGNNDAAEADVEEPGETTHLCTADGQGNIVALTQSIQSLFGAKVANGQLGFLYNNYLSTCKRRPHPYQLGSGCIPLSNVAPTLVLRGRRGPEEKKDGSKGADGPLLAVGAAGSRRIVSSILHVIAGIVDGGMSLEEAVRLPRIHGLLARKVYIERPAATQTLLGQLEKHFHKVTVKDTYSYSMGGVQAIHFRGDRAFVGMADPRRDGIAIGL